MWIITFLLASGLTFSTPPRELPGKAACEEQAQKEAAALNAALGVPALVGYLCSSAA